jgi:hypothetical protein
MKNMKIIKVLLMTAVLSVMPFALQAQNYAKLWKNVETLRQKDEPQSACNAARLVYEKATAVGDEGWRMKSLLTMMQLRTEVSSDSFYTDVRKLMKMIDQTQSVPQRAVCQSVLASCLSQRETWSGGDDSQQSELPDDMAEWTGEQYKAKAQSYLLASVEQMDVLHKAKAKDFIPLVESGADSKYYQGDLLSLLGLRAAHNLPDSLSSQVLHRMMNVYRADGNREAQLLLSLDSLSLVQENVESTSSRPLENLIKSYGDLPLCVEAYIRLTSVSSLSDSARFAWAKSGIERYPKEARTQVLRNYIIEQTRSMFDIAAPSSYYPNVARTSQCKYRNLGAVRMKLYKLNITTDELLKFSPSDLNANYVKTHGTFVLEKNFTLPSAPEYRTMTDSVSFSIPETGTYAAVFDSPTSSDKAPTLDARYALLYASRLRMISQGISQNTNELTVVDGWTGIPVKNAKVSLYTAQRSGNKTYFSRADYTTDANGHANLPVGVEYRQKYVVASTATDCSVPWSMFNGGFYSNSTIERTVQTHIYTDRGIYRPGQTVHAAAVTYTQLGDSVSVLKNKPYTMRLRDANYKEIATKQLTTDEYGTVTADFVLPSSTLAGVFQLQMENGYASFRVEEYKRPTFEVVPDTVRTAFTVGDTVQITGIAKTFSGAPVIGASVAYTVRTNMSFFRFSNGSLETHSGQTMTDGSGRFSFPVIIRGKSTDAVPLYRHSFYLMHNDVTIEVTSSGGETQSAEVSLPCGRPSAHLTSTMDTYLDKDAPKACRIILSNLKGVELPSKGQYSVLRGKSVVAQGTFDAGVSFVPTALYALPSGSYEVMACVDKTDADTLRQTVVLCSMDAVRPASEKALWTFVKATTYADHRPAMLQVGSSLKDARLFYHLYSGNKCLVNKTYALSDSVINFQYDTSLGKGAYATFVLVNKDECHTYCTPLTQEEPDKALHLKWTTFRDKLRPGQQEEWKMQILDKNNRPVNAQFMATLYDASLDVFCKNPWNLGLSFNRSAYYPQVGVNYYRLNDSYLRSWLSVTQPNVKGLVFNHFDESLLQGFSGVESFPLMMSRGRTRLMGANRMAKVANADMAEFAVASAAPQASQDASAAENKASQASSETTAEPLSSAPRSLRTNLNETAFFYPQLRTDAHGNVSVKFTLPEALTTWRFQGLAHTTDMNYGQIESSTVASKDFMLQPNLPRFLRVADLSTLSATVFNLTNKSVSAVVRCELFDPETEQVVMTTKVNTNVSANGSQTVTFPYTASDKYPVLACRMTADGGNFSDGEQNFLPVLPDKQLVTMTVPFVLTHSGDTNVSLESLKALSKGDSKLQSLTVEFTNNPSWYAIQALPDVAAPQTDNAYSWAAAYYAQTLAAQIANSTPRIRSVIDSWQRQKGTSQTLWSNLQKNEDLKQILLQETPWVLDAENEQAQKERLSTLFDVNAIANSTARYLDKLRDLQQSDGSFSWCKGMNGDRWMTSSIAELLVRLQKLLPEGLPADAATVLNKAFGYLHQQELEEVNDLKQSKKRGETITLPSFGLQMLYVNALNSGKMSSSVRSAEHFLLDLLEQQTTSLSMYDKARAVTIWMQNSRQPLATEWMKSILEHTVRTEALGRYFDNNRRTFLWLDDKIPTQTAAIEALRQVRPDDVTTANELLQWLLSTKRVRSWNSPIASVNAIYALLSGNMSRLDAHPEANLKLTYSGSPARTVCTPQTASQKSVAGLGYYRETLPVSTASQLPVALSVSKSDAATSWGAVYAQSLQPYTDISSSKAGLSVARSYWVEQTRSNDKPLLVPLKGALKVGDKLIARLVVSADQNYDYVQLRDGRPACCEPAESLSGYRWQGGAGYYCVVRDAATDYFFDHLQKGTYVLEQRLYVTRTGAYQSGIAQVQCAYAPEFASHTAGETLHVNK